MNVETIIGVVESILVGMNECCWENLVVLQECGVIYICRVSHSLAWDGTKFVVISEMKITKVALYCVWLFEGILQEKRGVENELDWIGW
jgi:hypothetical protein